MNAKQPISLRALNSFNVESTCSEIYFPKSLTDLQQLPDLTTQAFYILGDGSNSLFVDNQAPIIIKPEFRGIHITESATEYTVTVGASENWHNLVCYCIEHNIYGLENLALIPGCVGAAPVQNIGAYGVEFADFCDEVHWYEFASKTVKVLKKEDCLFAYRDSSFKQERYNKGVIIKVVLVFPKKWQANLSYQGLDSLPEHVNSRQVMEKVIEMRQSKLPDPEVLANAGSFFKNPVVTKQQLHRIKDTYPDIPFYQQHNGDAKLAAGWLIEQAGLKGFCWQGVGVHKNQALVLVNYSSEQGKDIVSLAKYIQTKIWQQFHILLVPEVRMITAKGEYEFDQLHAFDDVIK